MIPHGVLLVSSGVRGREELLLVLVGAGDLVGREPDDRPLDARLRDRLHRPPRRRRSCSCLPASGHPASRPAGPGPSPASASSADRRRAEEPRDRPHGVAPRVSNVTPGDRADGSERVQRSCRAEAVTSRPGGRRATARGGRPAPAPPSPRPSARTAAAGTGRAGPSSTISVGSPARVTVCCGRGRLLVGLIATRQTIGSPLEMPPSMPPWRFVAVPMPAGLAGRTASLFSTAAQRSRRAKPAPYSNAVTAGSDSSALPGRP